MTVREIRGRRRGIITCIEDEVVRKDWRPPDRTGNPINPNLTATHGNDSSVCFFSTEWFLES